MAKLNHDPIQTVIKVINELFPDNKINIVYTDSRNRKFRADFFKKSLDEAGRYIKDEVGQFKWERFRWGFADLSKDCIFIDVNSSIPAIVDLIAHEFARLVIYYKGEGYDNVSSLTLIYKTILREYAKAAKSEIKD